MSKITGQRVEVRGRRLLNDLADRGILYATAMSTNDKRSLTALVKKQFAVLLNGQYMITHQGYAWLIASAAEDLASSTTMGSKAAKLLSSRIRHLCLLDELAEHGPVTWKGERA